MKPFFAAAAGTAALFLTAGAAEAQASAYQQCPHREGEDIFLMTSNSPGCAFGQDAYQPLLKFARTGLERGVVPVHYRRRLYRLSCSLYSHGEGVRCLDYGLPWMELEEDSAG